MAERIMRLQELVSFGPLPIGLWLRAQVWMNFEDGTGNNPDYESVMEGRCPKCGNRLAPTNDTAHCKDCLAYFQASGVAQRKRLWYGFHSRAAAETFFEAATT